VSLLTWTWRVLPAKKVNSFWTMFLSSPVCQRSRRLMTADNVIQRKNSAMLLARDSTTSCVSKPKGRKISLKSSSPCRIWSWEPAESKARDWDTILSSSWTTSSTDDSSSSASTPTITETSHNYTWVKFWHISLLQKFIKLFNSINYHLIAIHT